MQYYKLNPDEKLIIKEAEANDAVALIRYVKQVADETNYLSFTGADFNKTEQEEIKIIEDHRNADNQVFLIARIDNEIVGMLNIRASQKSRLKHVGELGVNVMKEHWGKGVGGLLLKSAIEWAKANKVIKRIMLKVSIQNKSAIQLYRKHGFEIEGLLKRDFFVDGVYIDGYIMAFLLD